MEGKLDADGRRLLAPLSRGSDLHPSSARPTALLAFRVGNQTHRWDVASERFRLVRPREARLTMRAVVKDVMSAHPISVAEDSSFKEMAARLRELKVSGFPAVPPIVAAPDPYIWR